MMECVYRCQFDEVLLWLLKDYCILEADVVDFSSTSGRRRICFKKIVATLFVVL